MIRQTQTEPDARLATKTLDQALLTQLQHQFGHSPFESRAILEVVKETYLGQLRTPGTLKPGQMVVLAIKADEPPWQTAPRVPVRTHCGHGPHLQGPSTPSRRWTSSRGAGPTGPN